MGVFRQAIAFSLATATALSSGWAQDLITFEQVLNEPTDPQLNITYAQQRIGAGDLLAAAATLERLLINEPNWDQARLMYASVLYQLGDFTAAKREADLLEGRDLSEQAIAEVEKYRSASTKKTKKTRFNGRVSVGLGYDENAGSQLADDGLPEIVDQFSMVLRGRAKLEHDLSDSTELRLFAEADAYYKQFEDDQFDEFLIASIRGGIAGETGKYDWRANVSVRNVTIGGSGYLDEQGVQARLMRDFTKKTRGVVNLGYHEQEYSSIFGDGDNSTARDGARFDAAATVFHSFSPKYRASLGLGYREKTVDTDDAPDGFDAEGFFAYNFVGATASFNVFWPSGVYADATAIYREYDYKGSTSAGFERTDDFLYGRAAFGLPLTILTGERAKEFFEPFLFETALSYSDRASSQDAFDFDSYGAETRLIYRF